MLIHASPRLTILYATPQDALERLGRESVDVIVCGHVHDTPLEQHQRPGHAVSPYGLSLDWGDLRTESCRPYARKWCVAGRSPQSASVFAGHNTGLDPHTVRQAIVSGAEQTRAVVEWFVDPGDVVLDLEPRDGALILRALAKGAAGAIAVCATLEQAVDLAHALGVLHQGAA